MRALSQVVRPLRLPPPRSSLVAKPAPLNVVVHAEALKPLKPLNLPPVSIAEALAPRTTPELVPQAVVARDVLVAVLKGKDTAQDARDLRKAITRLLELSPQLGQDKVDQLLCGFLGEAVVGNRGALLDAWVEAISGAPADLLDSHRKLALLKGAALPVAPHLWSATRATGPTSPHRYAGPPLLIRIFNTLKLRQDFAADERWKAPTTRDEHTLSNGVHAYVGALLDSSHVADAQAAAILCTTFHSVGRDEITREFKRKEFNAMNFAMQQGHLCAAGFMLMAIGDSQRSLGTKALILGSLGLDRALFSQRLTALKQMPLPVPPNKDPYRWARDLSKWSANFLSACDLMTAGGRVQLATDDASRLQQCRDANLRAIDFEPAGGGHPASVICSSKIVLSYLSHLEVVTDDQAPRPGAHLYAIPVSALALRHEDAVQANL